MAGPAAARLLSARAAPFAIGLAMPRDDEAIRRLLRGSVFGGSVRLSLEREPDAFAAAAIEGDVHQLLVARRPESGAIVAVAARSVRDAFVNGVPVPVGYLGLLRVERRCRHLRALLADGFAFCRTLPDAGTARLYLASIAGDNQAALRLLVERRAADAPRFVEAGRLVTLAMPTRRPPRAAAVDGLHVAGGSPALVEEIVACLDRNLRRFQFAPRWTAGDLASPVRTRGLSIEDFAVAIRGGRVVGCLALWDQRAFKQVVVRGYAPPLARWRPLVNLATRWTGAPALPAPGQPLRFACLSHVAVDRDRPEVMAALVAAACRRAGAAGLDYVALGLAANHPLREPIGRSFPHRTFDSVLYVVYWPDGAASARALDGRILQPEVAVL